MLDKSPSEWDATEWLVMSYAISGLALWVLVFSMLYVRGLVGLRSLLFLIPPTFIFAAYIHRRRQ
jgi:hypothetical protein